MSDSEYIVRIGNLADKKLNKLPSEVKGRILGRLKQLRADPRPHGCLKLEDDQMNGWRIRVGKLRILYQIDDAARVVSCSTSTNEIEST